MYLVVDVFGSYAVNLRNTPPNKSIADLVTVLTVIASGKIELTLIPSACSSSELITVSCASVSKVPFLALACPASDFLTRSGKFSCRSL